MNVDIRLSNALKELTLYFFSEVTYILTKSFLKHNVCCNRRLRSERSGRKMHSSRICSCRLSAVKELRIYFIRLRSDVLWEPLSADTLARWCRAGGHSTIAIRVQYMIGKLLGDKRTGYAASCWSGQTCTSTATCTTPKDFGRRALYCAGDCGLWPTKAI